MVYLHPMLTDAELATCYDHAYEEEWGEQRDLKQALEHMLVKRLPVSPPGRLLDVGCGTGAYLATAEKEGWDATGIDPWARNFTGRNVHPKVLPLDVREANFGNHSFDVITMWWVIEHYRNPLSKLSHVRRLLKPDGWLVVSTSNIQSLEARMFGRYWHHLLAPEHCCQFSPETVENMLRRTGFEVVGVRHVPLTGGVVGSMAAMAREKGWLRGPLHPFVAALGLPLEALFALMRRSALFTVLARPVQS